MLENQNFIESRWKNMLNKRRRAILFSFLILGLIVFSFIIFSNQEESDVLTDPSSNIESIKDRALIEQLRRTDVVGEQIEEKIFYYDSSKKMILIEDKDYKTIIKIRLDSPYVVSNLIASNDTKVAEFYLEDWKDGRTNMIDSINFYDVKDNYKPINKNVRFKWADETWCIDEKNMSQGECYTIWKPFETLSELPHKNIKISMWANTERLEKVEWVPTIEGFEILQWAEWDISTAIYEGFLDVSAKTSTPKDIYWSADGSEIYILGGDDQDIFQYTCSIAWNVSTCTYTKEKNIAINSYGMFFEPNGNSVYLTELGGETIQRWFMSGAWDITTAVYGSEVCDVSSEGLNPISVFIKSDGTKMYTARSGNNLIHRYTLSPAWNLTGCSFDAGQTYDTTSQDEYPIGIFFDPDGDKMFHVGDTNDGVYQYAIGTSWDLTTVSYNDVNISIIDQDVSSRGSFFKADGTKMYVVGEQNNKVYQYGLTITDISSTLNVTLNSPTNESHLSSSEITFNASYTFSYLDTTNATYYIYNSTGIFNKTKVDITPVANSSELDFGNFTAGNYEWNVYACGINSTSNVICNWSSVGNYTFEWIPFTEDTETHSTTALETESQSFQINVTTTGGYTVSSGNLIYNGTTYTNANKVQIDSDSYSLTKSIYIPAMDLGSDFNSTNVTFHWNISLTNEATGGTSYSTTSDYNQTINELKFQACSTIINITMINFTLYDESTESKLNATSNATSFQASFNFGVNSGNKIKNYSFGNLSSSNSSFIFCTDNSSRIIYVDMVSLISAVDYAERNYYLSNSTLTNTINEISIYLILEDAALEFFITITEGLRAIAGASVQVAKFFIGEGIYKTIEIDETDSNGEFNVYLDLDRDYQATIIKDGEVLGIKTFKSSCAEAPCKITLDIQGATQDIFGLVDSQYAQNIVYNLSYNASNKVVTFQFVDITGLATYFRMAVYNSNSSEDASLVSNQSLYTSSGSLTFNVSDYDGQFKVDVFVSRSPEVFITFIQFLIAELYEEFGDYAGEALLLGFLLIVTFIFGLAFKPSVLMMAIPIIMHLGVISGIFPISMIVVTVLYVFAILGVVAIGKGS